MASKTAIMASFMMMADAGLVTPKTWDLDDEERRESILATWVLMTRPVEDEAYLRAVMAYMADGPRFWPTVGELVTGARAPSKSADWEPVWARLMEGVRFGGRRNPPSDAQVIERPLNRAYFVRYEGGVPWRLSPDDDANNAGLAAVRTLGGWEAVCDMDEAGIPFRRKEFAEMFRNYIQRREALVKREEVDLIASGGLRLLTGGRE